MIKFHNTARGEYMLSVLRGGEEILRTPWRPNIITNAGLDSLAQTGSNATWGGLAVGTGTDPVEPTDVALASQLAHVGGSFSYLGVVSGNTCTHTAVFTFPLGAVVGNISELGIKTYNSTPTFTRALVTDTNGSPTSVTVTAADQLVVTYRIVFTVDQSIQTATVVDPNSSISYTIQCGMEAMAPNFDLYGISGSSLGTPYNSTGNFSIVGGTFGGPGEPPSGGVSQPIPASTISDISPPYAPGTFQQEAVMRFSAAATSLDRDDINIIRTRSYVPTANIKFHFDPPFRKPATYTCELGWIISWGRG